VGGRGVTEMREGRRGEGRKGVERELAEENGG
jgi:hypothetical protein